MNLWCLSHIFEYSEIIFHLLVYKSINLESFEEHSHNKSMEI